MRCHGRQAIQGIEDFFLPAVLGAVDDLGLFRERGHPFLGKGSSRFPFDKNLLFDGQRINKDNYRVKENNGL